MQPRPPVQVAARQKQRSSVQKALGYWRMMAASSAFQQWRQTCWVRPAHLQLLPWGARSVRRHTASTGSQGWAGLAAAPVLQGNTGAAGQLADNPAGTFQHSAPPQTCRLRRRPRTCPGSCHARLICALRQLPWAQELADERDMLRAAVQAMRLCRARAAFAAWLDHVAARGEMRARLLSAVQMFAGRSCVQAMRSWKVSSAGAALCRADAGWWATLPAARPRKSVLS